MGKSVGSGEGMCPTGKSVGSLPRSGFIIVAICTNYSIWFPVGDQQDIKYNPYRVNKCLVLAGLQ
jgi:hypothetical protein